ncbi:YbaB/EbfC family nucleoid-associated protein [Phytohabitans sp. ZYX-F-186]|uniref:YbaB/EbfC family nucleoid-associated protein n=1 Tax=Phytohabitans maris TaxID=3071409 RepID=A0ABU0ZQR4_9ACTN|nr:YbaB/EbfC family nucleoid-associated protein [Phytohabitans sp. ZYX-F-186]MDQ7909371.1 YbaB/EbfC family nucleoid-associated protein [Phytohabitans sp. ZYX-F-186]
MADATGPSRARDAQVETAFAVFAEEQRKLADFQRRMRDASTTVESPNKMVTATFDGRGELVRLTFNNTKYRGMAPTELASVITETLARGRSQAFNKIGEMAGGDVLPGVSFGDLAAGKVDLDKVVGTMMTSVLDLPAIARALKGEEVKPDGR